MAIVEVGGLTFRQAVERYKLDPSKLNGVSRFPLVDGKYAPGTKVNADTLAAGPESMTPDQYEAHTRDTLQPAENPSAEPPPSLQTISLGDAPQADDSYYRGHGLTPPTKK